MKTEKVIELEELFDKIDIKNKKALNNYFKHIYQKENELVRLWCQKIQNATREIDDNDKTPNQKKQLNKTHRDFLVRWLAQIDDDGSDSYSIFRSIIGNAEIIAKAPQNWLISESAFDLIKNAKDNNNKEVPDIVFEHNPPVKVIWELLDNTVRPLNSNVIKKIKDNMGPTPEAKKVCDSLDKMVYPINSVEILNICEQAKYCVMIITQTEKNAINTEKLKQAGDFFERIKAAKITSFYRKKVSNHANNSIDRSN